MTSRDAALSVLERVEAGGSSSHLLDGLKLPSESLKKLGVTARELDMAERLVEEMTEEWDPARYRDTYRDDLMARIKAKVKAGKTRELTQPTEDSAAEPRKTAQVIDLMALLKRSLDERGEQPRAKRGAPARSARPRKTRKRA